MSGSTPGSARPVVGSDDGLLAVGKLLLNSVDLTEVLQGIADGLCRFAGCTRSVIVDFDQETGLMRGLAGHGVPDEAVEQIRTYVHETPLVRSAIDAGESMLVHDPSPGNAVPDRYLQLFDVQGTLGVAPLNSDELGILGVAFVDRSGAAFEFTPREADAFKAFCDLGSLAMQNAILVERSQQLAAMLERSRIAAELHDGVTQLLFSAGIEFEEILDDPDLRPAVAEKVQHVRDQVEEGGRQLRQALFELGRSRPRASDTIGAVREVLEEFAKRTGLLTDLDIVGGGTDLVGPRRTLIVRTVAEALRNVEKYADATEVVVRIRRGHAWWMVDVDDDGCGDPRAIRRHLNLASDNFGLYSLAQAANDLGGRLWVSRPPRLRGVCLSISIPVRDGS